MGVIGGLGSNGLPSNIGGRNIGMGLGSKLPMLLIPEPNISSCVIGLLLYMPDQGRWPPPTGKRGLGEGLEGEGGEGIVS